MVSCAVTKPKPAQTFQLIKFISLPNKAANNSLMFMQPYLGYHQNPSPKSSRAPDAAMVECRARMHVCLQRRLKRKVSKVRLDRDYFDQPIKISFNV